MKAGDDDCWSWTDPVTNGGHPTIGRGGKGAGQTSACIVAYRIIHGTDPDREVLNTCDNKLCLKPRHLVLAGQKFLATLRERLEARVEKAGRLLAVDAEAHRSRVRLPVDGEGKRPAYAHRAAWELTHGPIRGAVRQATVRQPAVL